MREIKFRAWEKGRGMGSQHTIQEIYAFCPSSTSEQINNYIFEQFTGLTDKNGVEIYEGDLLKIHHPASETSSKQGGMVEFKNAYVGGWVLTHPDIIDEWLSLGARLANEMEVVGNIHKTPELLEAAQ